MILLPLVAAVFKEYIIPSTSCPLPWSFSDVEVIILHSSIQPTPCNLLLEGNEIAGCGSLRMKLT